jgi:hypothetical protein
MLRHKMLGERAEISLTDAIALGEVSPPLEGWLDA